MSMKMMAKMLMMIMAICISISPAYAEKTENSNVNQFIYQDVQLIDAAREVCLLYQGQGFWGKAAMETVGCSIMEIEGKDDLLTLAVYSVHAVFDLSSDIPQSIAGSQMPVSIVLRKTGGKSYELVSYAVPDDGEYYERSVQRLFSKETAQKLLSSEKNGYIKSATADAYAMAEAYLAYKAGGKKSGVWVEFLQTGSNAKAMQMIRNVIGGQYPYYIGSSIWLVKNRLYTVSVEGEQSYSGILSFATYDAEGHKRAGFKLQVQGDQVIVLEGELPELLFE